jgi:EAL domain-containing protein (putative c-di-GMP-specific phosphodiesterase class I)
MAVETLAPGSPQDRLSGFYERALYEGSFRAGYSLPDGRVLSIAFHPILIDGEPSGVLSLARLVTAQETADERPGGPASIDPFVRPSHPSRRVESLEHSPDDLAPAFLQADLYCAIENRQFEFFYQPQIHRHKVIGVECLIRWHHPSRGLVMPADFIPAAEESGLILPMSIWGLETACAQIAAWSKQKRARDMTVSVNISALHIRQPDFVEQVLGVVERAQINPRRLRLELTENMLADNIADTMDKMARLHARGIRFSLGDFGTGCSSLAYLKKLPLDTMKIDREFVKDMLTDHASAAIASTIVSLGIALGITVIAEGVETDAQKDFLAQIGCDKFQGYLFSRPLPLAELELFLQSF